MTTAKRPRLRVVSLSHGDKPVVGSGVVLFEETAQGLVRLTDVKSLTLHVASRQARLTATVTRLHHAQEVHYDDVVLGPVNGDPGPGPTPVKYPPDQGVESMSEFAIVNRSGGRVSDRDCYVMTEALSKQLPKFCEAWGFAQPVVSFYPEGTDPPSSAWIVSLIDQPDVDGALAYHSDDDKGRPDAFVFAGFIQDNGGKVLAGENSVAGALSHEVLELLRDPACTLWVEMPVTGPDGKPYARVAAEACDPVQSGIDSYEVQLSPTDTVERVDLSAYVLPAWEDPLDAVGPYSSDGKATHPGAVAAGGYAVFETAAGRTTQVMAEGFPEHLARLKSLRGRGARRNARTVDGEVVDLQGGVEVPAATTLADADGEAEEG